MEHQNQNQNQNNNVRHSEKSMIASCSFADAVADCAKRTFDQVIRSINNSDNNNNNKKKRKNLEWKQTVLSAFILCDERKNNNNNALRCISFGVGTKFLSREKLQREEEEEEKKNKKNNDQSQQDYLPTLVRDQHAEMLARRALQFLLRKEIEEYSLESKTSNNRILQLVSPSSEKAEPRKFRLADGCSLHLYTSSTPCGNACLKRFASGSSSKAKPNKKSNEEEAEEEGEEGEEEEKVNSLSFSSIPQSVIEDCSNHSPFHIVQRQAAQVALLCKKSAATTTTTTSNNNNNNNNDSLDLPTGTELAQRNSLHQIPCCSGKIAAFNFLSSYEGLLLRRFISSSSSFSSGIIPSSIVIGRKFSSIHCQRALCCRVDFDKQQLPKQDKRVNKEFYSSFVGGKGVRRDRVQQQQQQQQQDEGEKKEQKGEKEEEEMNPVRVHHPLLFSTSVKLDGSIREGDVSAEFSETRTFWWTERGSEILCGSTGRVLERFGENCEDESETTESEGERSETSSCSLLLAHLENEKVRQEACLLSSLLLHQPQSNKKNQAEPEEEEPSSSSSLLNESQLESISRIRELTSHPLLFQEWPRSDLVDSFVI